MQEIQEMGVWSRDQEDRLEQEMATHSTVLAWEIPWTEDPGGLQSMGFQRVKHDWGTKHIKAHVNIFTSLFTGMRRADGTCTVLMRPLQALSIYIGSNLMEHLILCPKFIQIKGIFHAAPDSSCSTRSTSSLIQLPPVSTRLSQLPSFWRLTPSSLSLCLSLMAFPGSSL